jgi:phosphohistidine phosphatase
MTGLLVVIRHAKAGEAPFDIDRPLTGRGRRDAAAIGDWLKTQQLRPDRAVVSPARRARETWQGAADRLDDPPEPVIDERIYDNTVDLLYDIVRETPDGVDTLVLVGHNPAFGSLAYELDNGDGERAARDALHSGFPTSAVAVLRLDQPWAATEYGSGALINFAAPRG